MTAAEKARAFALPALAGLAGIALGALAIRTLHARDIHPVRTNGGWALVETVLDEDGAPVRVLRQGGVYQSATYLDERRFEPVFAYYRAFDRLFEARAAGFQTRDVLMLGGGGYAWPKHVLTRNSTVRLDVVEIDPAVTDIAHRWFFLDELIAQPGTTERLRLITADGRAYVDESPCAYDAIVNDTFSGRTPVRTLATVEAARSIKRCLRPGGVYLTNVVSEAQGADVSFLRAVVATLRQAFARVHVVPCTDEDFGEEDNYLVIATDAPHLFSDAIPYDEDFPTEPLWDARSSFNLLP